MKISAFHLMPHPELLGDLSIDPPKACHSP
jgi:hypothetical protein